jgi:hypothetical protein
MTIKINKTITVPNIIAKYIRLLTLNNEGNLVVVALKENKKEETRKHSIKNLLYFKIF